MIKCKKVVKDDYMKKWKKVLIVIAIIIAVIIIGIEVIYRASANDCCSCCDDSAEVCISACCNCNYNMFEKIVRIIDSF